MVDPLLTRHADSLMVLAAPSQPDVRERVTPALVSQILRTLRSSSTSSWSTPRRSSTSRR